MNGGKGAQYVTMCRTILAVVEHVAQLPDVRKFGNSMLEKSDTPRADPRARSAKG
jgi:hypothetical protein